MAKQLTELKKNNVWLTATYSQVLQQSIIDLDTALKNIKKTGAGFPRFKSKYTTPVSFRYQQNVSVDNDRLYLPKIGHIKIVLHRHLPTYKGVTVTQTPRGWYASFVVDVSELPLVKQIANSVGVDVNSVYTALSTGVLIANPRPLKQKQNRIKLLQRKLAKKQKASKNRKKAQTRLARTHDLVRCQRLDHIHQTSARIAKSHDLVAVETLNIDQMRGKSKPTAKCIADAGWAMLAHALAYKCQLRGHHMIKINQWLPSSKTCSACGTRKHHLDLREREYHCDGCGVTEHRDINAAVNIKNWGLQQWTLDHAGQELPQAPVDVIADVLTNWGEISASMIKQEATTL